MKKKATQPEPPKITAEDKKRILAQLENLEPAVAVAPAPDEPEPLSLREQLAAVFPAAAAAVPLDGQALRAAIFANQIAPRLAEFGFEPRYRVDGLLQGKDERCGFQRRVLAAVREKFIGKGAIVALVGPRGTGKTHIAAEFAARWIWEEYELGLMTRAEREARGIHGVPRRIVKYKKLSALVAKLKAYYASFGSTNSGEVLSLRESACSCNVLVVDEISDMSDDQGFKWPLLKDILDVRYSRHLDTLIISNQTKTEFEATCDPSVRSRLAQHGGTVRCEWASFRDFPAEE